MKSTVCYLLLIWCISHVSCTCLDTGRYPNNAEEDCRGFTMCLKGAAGFMQYNLMCPENSIFSHIDSQCTNVTDYQCLPNYNCTKVEKILEPSNENCTTFIECVKDINDVYSARLINCPVDTVFNGSLCVDKDVYQCPRNIEIPSTTEVIEKSNEGNVTRNSATSRQHLHHILYFISFLWLVSII